MDQNNDTAKKIEGDIHFIRKANKQDTQQVITSSVLELSDEFQSLYFTPRKNTNVIIEPPYNPLQLATLIHRNNILAQCIVTMEVNVDGSGYTFELLDEEKDKITGDTITDTDQKTSVGMVQDGSPMGIPASQKPQDYKSVSQIQKVIKASPQSPSKDEDSAEPVDKELEMLEHFFNEPYPGMSFTTIRRKLRHDIEATGNGYLEVIRNIAGEIVFVRHLDSVMMRLVKLDAPTDVEVTVTRGDKEVKAILPLRERRYAYKVGATILYYREFGSSRKVNKKTGAWIEPDSEDNKKIDILGSEIIHFIATRDFRTNYGLPRWINQLPSVLGSRKAEEYNLEFFDAGGLPPAIIFIQGGALVGGVKDQLQHYLSGKASQKHRAAIVEVMSTSGSLDSAGSVSVKVERFGPSATDIMFNNYDIACGEHIRKSFRLPKVLVGDTDIANRSVTEAAIQAAENQVFQPERYHFDEVINTTIIKALGAKKYRFRSLSMNISDPQIQLNTLTAAGALIKGEDFVDVANELSGLKMKYSAEAEASNKQQGMGQPPDQGGDPMGGDPSQDGQTNPPPGQGDPQSLPSPPQFQGNSAGQYLPNFSSNSGVELGQAPPLNGFNKY